MDIMSLIDTLEDLIDKGSSLPLTSKTMVDKKQLLDIVRDIRLKLPSDLKQAKWVKEESQRVILEARVEADNIIKEAENRVNALVEEDDITKKAYAHADEIVENAKATARDIRLGAKEYADEILQKVQSNVQDGFNLIYDCFMNDFKSKVYETLQVLDSNREELQK